MLRLSVSTFFALALCALAPAFGQVPAVSSTRVASFPPITFGTTETLEVTLANVAGNPTSTTAPAASCAGSVSFLNSSGSLIGTASTFTLTAGEATSITLPFASLNSSGPRAAVRASISLTPATGTPRPACDLVFSLEISDSTTGATHAIVTSSGGAPSVILPLAR